MVPEPITVQSARAMIETVAPYVVLIIVAVVTLVVLRSFRSPRTTSISPVRADPNTTYRLRGIPCDWQIGDLHTFLSSHSDHSIKSLAKECRDDSKTATATFHSPITLPWEPMLPVVKADITEQNEHLVVDDGFLGITTLYSPPLDDHKLDIVAISGLGGHAFGSFKQRNGRHMWLRDSLPFDLTDTTSRNPMARIMIYGYESQVPGSNSMQNLADIGSTFRQALLLVAKKAKPIIIVAHSLGGLVAKEALIMLAESDQEGDQDLLKTIHGVIFFGVPHHGMKVKSLRSMAGDRPNRFLIESLDESNSQVLNTQRRQFQNSFSRKGDISIFCFYETVESPSAQKTDGRWKMTGPSEILVSQSSATHCRPWEDHAYHVCAISRTHSEMVKFASRDHDYDHVLVRLQSMAKDALTDHRRKTQSRYAVQSKTVDTFTERHELWTELQENMQIHHESAQIPFALAVTGMGGAGKSQLALKYAEEYKEKYNPILWIDATSEESARSSYEHCAIVMELQIDRTVRGSTIRDDPAFQAVTRWLRSEARMQWLVIVDNADQPEWGLRRIIPEGDLGSVIITSQDRNISTLVSGGCEMMAIDVMSQSECRALFGKHIIGIDTSDPAIQRCCDQMAEKLGWLALALDIVGAFIKGHIADAPSQTPLQALRYCLKAIDRHREKILQLDPLNELSLTKRTIRAVWDVTLSKLEVAHNDFRPGLLLKFLARFKGSIIQEEIFRSAALNAENLEADWDELQIFLCVHEGVWDELPFQEAVRILVRYNLLQRVGGAWAGVTMHKLIQWRALQDDQDCLRKRHLDIVLAACAQDQPQFRQHLVVHIPELYFTDGAQAFATVGRIYQEEGRFQEVETMLLRLDTALGPKYDHRTTVLLLLVSIYIQQSKLAAAEALCTSLMEDTSEGPSSDSPVILKSMFELARTYHAQCRYEEAAQLLLKVVEKSKEMFGENHPQTLGSMAYLAPIYTSLGRTAEAESVLSDLAERYKIAFGPDHGVTLATKRVLASIYVARDQLERAEELQAEIAKTWETTLGPEHPNTLHSMLDLALTYLKQNKFGKSAALRERVLNAQRLTLSPDHPEALVTMCGLAFVYLQQSKLELSADFGRQALEKMRVKLGDDHPETLLSMWALAVTYQHQGRLEQAAALGEECLSRRRTVLGPERSETLQSMLDLASTYEEQGRLHDAKALLEEIVRKCSVLPWGAHLGRSGKITLARVYRALLQVPEAEALELEMEQAESLVVLDDQATLEEVGEEEGEENADTDM